MNKQIEIFSRVANSTVNRYIKDGGMEPSKDYIKDTINNVNMINQTLIATAIKLVKKAKSSHNLDIDELTNRLNDIIQISVTSYVKRAY